MGFFKFEYKPESELGPKTTLLTPGEASFKIVGAYDKKKDGSPLTTMSGAPKLNISMSVIDIRGETSMVYDDLTANTAWKIKALLDAVGLGSLYDATASFDSDDLIGKTGKCVIETRKSEGYEDRTSIKRYIKNSQQLRIEHNASEEDPNLDQDIPF